MWSVASLENMEANKEYSEGSVGLDLDFSAAVASSVAVVSLAMIGDPAGIKWEPHRIIQWMAQFCRAWPIYSFLVSQLLYTKRCWSATALTFTCCGGLTEGRTKWDSCRLVSTEKEQKSSWDWLRDSLMERVFLTQSIVGLSSFSQGSPRITFSFPRFIM